MRQVTLVGAVTRDLVPDSSEWIPGGAVIYAGAAASALGTSVRVVTTHGADFSPPAWSRAWRWQVQHGATTQFQNIDSGDAREQWLWARSAPLCLEEIASADWHPTGWVVLAPVFDELDLEAACSWCANLPLTGRCLIPQGWLRRVSVGQLPKLVEPRKRLLELVAVVRRLRVYFDCICLSETEVQAEPDSVEALRGVVRVLAVTRGARGATIFTGNARFEIGVAAVSPLDATGAGDAFAGALVAALSQGEGLPQAARLASAAGALSTEQRGARALDHSRLVSLASAVSVAPRAT